jgi:CheY-like chemotaxis protein
MSARHASPVMLYVEDEEADVFFMRRAFQQCRMLWQVHTVADGREAFSYVLGSGKYSDRKQFPQPDIVLLDLHLPLMSGFEVLAAIRSLPEYINLPVVMFSASSRRDDRRRANQLGANGYITKPFSNEDCAQTAMEIQSFYERCDRVAAAEARRGSVIRI